MVGFMADMLILENVTVNLNFVPKIVLLVIDLWVIGFVLRCKVWCENSKALVGFCRLQHKD